jgi:hypothetical protein
MLKRNLSGKTWWKTNQAKYPNSRRIEDLESNFRGRVEKFIKTLKWDDAGVRVTSTRRNAIRAYLMRYSWDIANGNIKPSEVLKKAGVLIDWDHGDGKTSRKAARQMKNLFGIVHRPSLTSNHIFGKAIDMRITWKGDLWIKFPISFGLYEIKSRPRNGKNKELHKIGAMFGVKKLRSDSPHWSYNGR